MKDLKIKSEEYDWNEFDRLKKALSSTVHAEVLRETLNEHGKPIHEHGEKIFVGSDGKEVKKIGDEKLNVMISD